MDKSHSDSEPSPHATDSGPSGRLRTWRYFPGHGFCKGVITEYDAKVNQFQVSYDDGDGETWYVRDEVRRTLGPSLSVVEPPAFQPPPAVLTDA